MTTTLDTFDASLDLDHLLEPIGEDQPAGEYLAEDAVYRQIEETRREDDPTLPQGVWSHELKRADWPQVVRLCQDALASRTKDLRIAAWMTEALVHVDGFAGAALGLRLIHGLCDTFWDTIHPLPDEENLDPRLSPLLWLDGRLANALKRCTVTRPDDGQDSPDLSWTEWEWALHLENLEQADPEAVKAAVAEDKITKDKFQISIGLTPARFYEELEQQLGQVEEARSALVGTLDRLAGKEAPSLRKLRQIVSDMSRFSHRILGERVEEDEILDDGRVDPDEGDTAGEGEKAVRRGAIRSRAEAYRLLSLASEYLMRTEPHSPAPYLVKRAVTWGNMTLIDLYKELLAGGADLKSIYRLLGIREDE